MKHLKYFMLFACLFVFLALFTSCAGNSYDGAATAYLNAFVRFDYSEMYDLLTPEARRSYTLEEFTTYHKKVYDMLLVQTAKVTRGEKTDNGLSQSFEYTVTFTSSSYGEFSYNMELDVVKKAEYYLISWSPSNVVEGMQEDDLIYKVSTSGKRGEIFDRDGRIIVKNDYAVSVYALKADMEQGLNATCSSIARILGLDESEVKTKFNESYGDTGIFATMFKSEMTSEQRTALKQLDNVYVEQSSITPIRYYPYGSALAQTLGYSTPITEEDRENEEYKYLPEGTRIGRSGLEKAYDSYLQPTSGFCIYLISDDARNKRVLYEQKAQDGKDLVLTVDIAIQQNITSYMEENYKDTSTGTANVVNPATGGVVALVSYPSYNANVYAYDKATNYGDLFENKNTPLLNRNIQGTYPPGSIFKSLMACIGLSTESVSTTTPFPYEDEIEYYTYEKDRWRPKGSNWSKYIVRQAFRGSASGTLDMYRALTWSDNIYFGWLAMKVGKESIISYAEKLGIGESIPFDLNVRKSQLANSYDTLNSQKLLADTGFGQAEMLFTPLQLCCSFSLFGNNGTIMQPYIVQSICSTNEKGEHVVEWSAEAKVYKANVFSSNVVLTVRNILENTATAGTGKSGTRGLNDTMTIASKTGTAQVSTNETGEIGWYAGYVISGGENDAVLVSADESDLKFGCVRYVFELLRDELLG